MPTFTSFMEMIIQDHDKADEPLKTRERKDSLEDRVSTLRTQVLSLTEKNEVFKNRLASIRLTQAAAEQAADEEPAVEERGGTPSRDGGWRLAEKMVALASIAAGVFCVSIVWMGAGRNDNDVNRELIASRKRMSALEANLKTQAEAPVDQTGLLKNALVARNAENQRLQLEALRMRKEIDGLRGDLSSLRKGKEKEIVGLEESFVLLKEKNREEIGKIKLENDKEMKALQNRIGWLNTTKAVAIPGLINALNHQNSKARNIIAATLSELTGKSYGTNQEKWREWWLRNRINFIRR